MKIAVVHNRVSDKDAPDARDVLQQVETVANTLVKLGHDVDSFSCTLNLEAAADKLLLDRPDLVFNLVEDLGGYGRLIHLFPFLLDAFGILYTGSTAETIMLSSNKLLAKERMVAAGLPTTSWACPCSRVRKSQETQTDDRKWIIKSLWEHASIGLDSDSVVEAASMSILAEKIMDRRALLGGACFAEEFIDGREFNLSMLAAGNGPEVLPPAEIIFEGYGTDMVRIVDYQAKWDEKSYTYHHTPRRFDFPVKDAELLKQLQDIARRCWDVFDLAGYARVDFRVDRRNRPYILEVNANPCLSPDAGFAAALAQADIDFHQALARIVADAPKKTLSDGVLSRVTHPTHI